ncbi:MAG: putative sulfate exporter family transporter [Nitrospirae bacterium]|nr:putative sulfate exporter family transporter [Nitrospirota bacterium]
MLNFINDMNTIYMMNNIKDILPGAMIVLLITMVSYMLSFLHPSFDMLVISIIFGMLFANLIREKNFLDDGIAFSLKIFLPAGIALYGTQLSFVRIEPKLWFYVIAVTVTLFLLTYFISKGVGLSKNIMILLSTGLSICGASAIMIVSPIIGAKKEEISISVIVIMVLGLSGMIFYPLLTDIMVLNKDEFAFLSGTTLPMMGMVKAAAVRAGQDALAVALNIKLIRISCLIFLPVVSLILLGKKNFHIPWFIAVFIVLAIGMNIIKETKIIKEVAEYASKFFLSSALAAIGLSVDFDSIMENGTKPLMAIFLSWGIVVLFLYLIFSIENV